MAASDSPIHILKPGRFRSGGRDVSFAESDLAAIASAYDPALHEAPIVVGHPRTDARAYGWVGSVRSESRGLYAVPRQVDAEFAEMVREGKFRKVSASFYGPGHPDSPLPEGWYLRHVGFLGAQPPVVKGLDQVQFADDGSDVVTFELDLAESPQGGLRSIVSRLRGLRESLIATSGMEAAERALPSSEIELIGDQADRLGAPGPSPSFSEPEDPAPTSEEEDPVSGETAAELAAKEANLAEREAALDTRESELADRAKAAAKADAVEFAERLASSGRILPRDQDAIVGVLMALPEDASVEFAENADSTPAPLGAGAYLRKFLERLPEQVNFSEVAPAPGDPRPAPAMKVPSGFSVAPENAELHRRALEFAEANHVDYDQAVVHVAREA